MIRSFSSWVQKYWLHGLGCIALVIALLYVEEDWRGARAWAATKAEWEAKGESFDRAKFIPPPVLEEQNLAALPLFKLEQVSSDDGTTYLKAVTLRHALRDDLSGLEIYRLSNSTTGETLDLVALRKSLAANYALATKGGTPPNDLLAQFNAIYPFFNDFISAAATRPFFRPEMDYLVSPPLARGLGPITDPIALAKILSLHTILSLNARQPERALLDLKTNLTLVSGTGRDPTLVGGLVSLGVAAINRSAIQYGLTFHAWNDAQLAELEKELHSVDFLAGFQFTMRAEATQGIGTMDFMENANRSELKRTLGKSGDENPVVGMSTIPWPVGWWDSNKRQMALFYMDELQTVNLPARLCDAKRAKDLSYRALQKEAAWDGWAPWNILAAVTAPALSHAIEKFAQGQVGVDETRIACALERYRLAHGVYPATLTELAPAFIDEVPHDIMNGEPYHYRLNADRTFLLYSVGWNQKDDGGTLAYMKNSTTSIDYEKGDWVWPTAKVAGKDKSQ